MKKTVLVGATDNPARYAYVAANMLKQKGHELILLGIKKGLVAGEEILDIRTKPIIDGVHTITMYIGSQRQSEWYDYLLDLSPKRIIFNPGTENIEFEKLANARGIETYHYCTLVLLSTGQY
jgi:uncharacterized protein